MKKRVWIINHYASEMYRSGGGRHHWFAKELIKNGYSPMIICSNVFYSTSNECIDMKGCSIRIENKEGVPYAFIKTRTYKRNDINRLLNILDFYVRVQTNANELEKVLKPDVIIASSVHPLACVAGIKLARKFKIPCISEIRDLWPEELIRDGDITEKSTIAKCLLSLEHWIYKNSDSIVFTQEGGVDYIKDQGWDLLSGGDIDTSKVFYINNGVDLESYKTNLKKYQLYDGDLSDDSIFKIIYTGAIRPTNGIDRLLNIGKAISDKPDIRILIWGDGDQVDHIVSRIEKEKIQNVKYKGRVEKKYIPYILSRSNINILNYISGNSFRYGCSNNKFFEYLAAEKPIICTVKMNYSIINRYKCGVEAETTEEIVDRILDIYNGGSAEEKQMRANASKAVKAFDFVAHTKKLIDIIESI